MQLRGCGTALVTPFRQDGSVDDAALRNLVAWQVESGIDFLVPCGTTGETPTLSREEWLYVIDATVEGVAGRVPVVAGATSNSTHDAVEKAKQVAGRPGVSAILTASPYYNKPTQEGQYRHFKAIAEACHAVPEHFQVFSGDDALTLPVIALGGVGIISVASNEIPREMAELTRAALNNDWVTARAIHRKYLALLQANFLESNPLPVEAGLITKPAAPAADAVEFYVYENWIAGPHKIVLHRASCGQCNHGKGRPAG